MSAFTRQLGLMASCRIAADMSSTHGVLSLYHNVNANTIEVIPAHYPHFKSSYFVWILLQLSCAKHLQEEVHDKPAVLHEQLFLEQAF